MSKARSSIKPGAATPVRLRFSGLPTYKLDVLNSLTARHGELLYQRLVGLRIVECRILGVVAFLQPATLKQTCIEIGIDKGQASRLVAKLIEAGLLDKRDDATDQRSFHLLLTPAGRAMHDRIAAAAAARNEQWLQGLPAAARKAFVDALDALVRQTQQMLRKESARSKTAPAPLPLHEQAEPAADAERPLVVAPAALRELRDRLDALLGKPAGR